MADLTVVAAELKFRDGRTQKIRVKAENNLVSLIDGIQQVSRDVSTLLSELVDKERPNGNAAGGDEEDDSDEDDEDTEDPQNSEIQPPAKKSKR